MNGKWIAIALAAVLVVGLVGGFLAGRAIFDVDTEPGVDPELAARARDLERELDRNRDALGRARAANRELTERNRKLTDILTRTEERQREVDTALGRAANDLIDAGDGARSITELAGRNVEILDELLESLGE